MAVLFAGEVPVHYRFIHLHPVGDYPFDDGVRGQSNGLCVIAEPASTGDSRNRHTDVAALPSSGDWAQSRSSGR